VSTGRQLAGGSSFGAAQSDFCRQGTRKVGRRVFVIAKVIISPAITHYLQFFRVLENASACFNIIYMELQFYKLRRNCVKILRNADLISLPDLIMSVGVFRYTD